MKIKCHNCGSQINANAKFCENCGTPIMSSPKKNKPQHKQHNKPKNNTHSSKRKNQTIMSQDKVRCPECGLRQDPRVGFCKRCGTNLKHVPLEFPEEDSYDSPRPKKHPNSMPRPSMKKTKPRETHPNSRFDEGYDEYYNDNNPNSRFDEGYEEYDNRHPPNRHDDYKISDNYHRPEIYHCPSCGVRLPSQDTVCPRCGYGQVTTIKSKNPVLAALLSVFIMGLGQLYTRQIIKGIMLFVIEVTCIFLSWLIIPLFFGFSFYIYGIIDAYEQANKITERVY